MTTTTLSRPASEAQKGFIIGLLAEREVSPALREEILAATTMTSSQATGHITALKGCPRKAPSGTAADLGVWEADGALYAVREFRTPSQELVRYARVARFAALDGTEVSYGDSAAHRVDWIRPEAKGVVYKLAGSGRKLTIPEIVALSIQFDSCFVCGRKLDVLASKERGIGPVCLAKIGGC